jgi:flagellar motor switch protein FliM
VTVTEASSGLAPRLARGRAGRRPRAGGPVPYDFRRPTALSREHIRALQIIFETFARQSTTLLTSTLRSVCQLGLVSVEQVSYDEYVSTLANPTVMHLLSIDPMPGVGVLEFTPLVAMTAIDHLLGGPGGPDQPERPLTEIESVLLRGIVHRMLGELRYAFYSVSPIQPEVVQVEYNPQFAQATAPSDMVVVATFELRVGAAEAVATLSLPYNSLVPVLDAAAGHGITSERERIVREQAALAVRQRLDNVPLDVSVRFQPARLTPRQILGLSVGDVIPLPHPSHEPLAVMVAERTLAQAVPGTRGKRLACLVVDSTQEAPDGDQ